MIKQRRIFVTGGPGGGKTTALDLFQREFYKDVCIVPEAATILFSGGVERGGDEAVLKATQKAIFNLQNNLENIIGLQNSNKTLICDRGTLDGLAYWPDSQDEFFDIVDSNFEDELSRYDAVLFFETGASSNGNLASNNPIRNESNVEAIALDEKLQGIWSKHPRYILIQSSDSFLQKIHDGVQELIRLFNTQ